MRSDVPEGWEFEPLSHIGTLHKGRGGSKVDEQDNGIPVVRYGELYTKHNDVIRSFSSYVSPSVAENYSQLQCGDLLFAGSGETLADIGKSAVFMGPTPALGSGDLIIFRPSERVDPLYLGYTSNSKPITEQKMKMGQGSSVIHIYSQNLEKLIIPLPPLAEQRKIATILTSVDEAIQATEAVIAQTRRVKEGLLQELLTKGIGHTRFKQTEIGEIPETWEVKRLEDMSALITKGESPKWQGFEYQSDGMAFITSQNVQDAAMDLRDVKYLSLEFHRKIGRSSLCKGDLLVNIVGASIGRAAIWEGQLAPANVNQAVAVLRIRSGALLPELVLSQFLSNRGQDYFGLSKVDSARPNVSLGNLRSFPVVVPPIAEQLDIALRIDSLEVTLRESISQSTALQQLKSGLLQDLLTGRVRVKNGE